jgi:hypothetical protein
VVAPVVIGIESAQSGADHVKLNGGRRKRKGGYAASQRPLAITKLGDVAMIPHRSLIIALPSLVREEPKYQ